MLRLPRIYTFKGTNEYMDYCDLDATLLLGSSNVKVPFNPDTSRGFLFQGKSMETTMETKK